MERSEIASFGRKPLSLLGGDKFTDTRKVYSTLSDDEKVLFSDSGIYYDDPNVIYRYSYKIKNKPYAFIEVLKSKYDKKAVYLAIAVDSGYRRSQIGTILLHHIENILKQNEYKTIYYFPHKKNNPSIQFATKNGYTNIDDTIAKQLPAYNEDRYHLIKQLS